MLFLKSTLVISSGSNILLGSLLTAFLTVVSFMKDTLFTFVQGFSCLAISSPGYSCLLLTPAGTCQSVDEYQHPSMVLGVFFFF